MVFAQTSRIHFALLIIGTAFYLFKYEGIVVSHDGISEADIMGIAVLCRNTMLYVAFLALVFGHALLWRSPSKHSGAGSEFENTA